MYKYIYIYTHYYKHMGILDVSINFRINVLLWPHHENQELQVPGVFFPGDRLPRNPVGWKIAIPYPGAN